MFWRVMQALIVIMLIAMISMVFANVLLRYGFESGLRGSEELSQLLFVWIVMLGAAYGLRDGAHISASDLSDLLFPARFLAGARIVLWLLVLIIMGAFTKGCFSQTISNWVNISQLTGLPLGIFYLSGVISGLAMMMLIIREIIDNAKRLRGNGAAT